MRRGCAFRLARNIPFRSDLPPFANPVHYPANIHPVDLSPTSEGFPLLAIEQCSVEFFPNHTQIFSLPSARSALTTLQSLSMNSHTLSPARPSSSSHPCGS